MQYVKGSITDSNTNVIAHCCNCFCTMGAGVAKAIKEKWPEAYTADCNTQKGDRLKFGSFTKTTIGNKTIYNLYGQYDYWGPQPRIDYTKLRQSIVSMRLDFGSATTIAIPKLGCGLAGGDWRIVSGIINQELEDYRWSVEVWDL